MGGLTLPFQASQDSDQSLFEVTCTSGGGFAIDGESYGTDQFGDSGVGVYGASDVGYGLFGQSESAQGVYGFSQSGAGVGGASVTGQGVWGDSDKFDGVYGTSRSNQHAGVSAVNDSGGFGVWARGSPAGYFVGDVQVTGDLILINSPASGDVAEDFDLEDDPQHADPGTVLIINQCGMLEASVQPYDTRVAGVVSGAGNLKPALVLQRVKSDKRRSPVALVGKTVCKVDATFGAIKPGDLLTTSETRGYAMKVTDRSKALGAILGKALAPLQSGRGLVPILVSLR